MKRSLLLLLALGILAGCSSAPPVRLAGIGNTSWQLVKLKTLKNGWSLRRPRQCARLLDSSHVALGCCKL